MRRIPSAEIERVKAQVDLLALMESRGVSLKQQGSNWCGFCPFHEDRNTPNLIVTPAKGLFRCMASQCGKAGNAIQFLQWMEGVSFRHAFELLCHGEGGAALERPANPGKRTTIPRLPCPLEAEAQDAEILEQTAAYYHERLRRGRAALDYLAGRGLEDEELIVKFGLGYADRSLGLRLPQRNRVSGEKLRGALIRLGIYRESGHEHLTGCIVVPLRDARSGQAVQLYGRRIEAHAPKEKRHLYLSRPLTGIFNFEALSQRELILCESLLDALTFLRHGMEAVSSTFGTANFTQELFEGICDAGVESVRLAFDADEAGEKAAEQASERLQGAGIECWRIRFPWGEDANSYALEQGGGALRQAVKDAQWLGAGRATVAAAAPPPQKSGEEEKPQESALEASELLSTTLSCSLVARESAAKERRQKEAAAALEGGGVSAAASAFGAQVVRKGDYMEVSLGPRRYRAGGLEKNNSLEVMKITLRLLVRGGSGGGEAGEALFHVDTLDLYRDGERLRFAERAAEETGLEKDLIKSDLGKVLLALEGVQEERLSAPLEVAGAARVLSVQEEKEALAFAAAPQLMERIAAALESCGLVGERNNGLAIYLSGTSRLLPKPLAVMIQSTSAAGKTTLMEAVLSLFPHEETVKYSAMTGQSLYYMAGESLKHKILAVVEEEGAEKAGYALKLLQSEQELRIASTGKDPHTGRMQTEEYFVEGPAAIVLTTTSVDIDEELMNRCLVLSVDESREQTERIQAAQRQAETPEGIAAAEERQETLQVLQNFQRLLKAKKVANPFATELTFTAQRTRTRRDHTKYLGLIKAIALLHQYQREPITCRSPSGKPVEMLPITLEDIEAANRIAPEVLGRSLDELPPQSRGLLESIKGLVRQRVEDTAAQQKLCLFSRREVRERIGWSETQTRTHLGRLEELEYVVRRRGRQGSGCLYELVIEAKENGAAPHIGLVDTGQLRRKLRL